MWKWTWHPPSYWNLFITNFVARQQKELKYELCLFDSSTVNVWVWILVHVIWYHVTMVGTSCLCSNNRHSGLVHHLRDIQSTMISKACFLPPLKSSQSEKLPPTVTQWPFLQLGSTSRQWLCVCPVKLPNRWDLDVFHFPQWILVDTTTYRMYNKEF